MDKIPYSFNGNLINDGALYSAWLPASDPPGAAAQVSMVERPDMPPIMAGKQIQDKALPVKVYLRGDPATQFGTISSWFDSGDSTLRKFVVQDAANANKQWQVDATPLSIPEWAGRVMTVSLAIPDYVWQSVTQNSGTITIAASGQMGTITPTGSLASYPILEITPTSAGGSGFVYRRWIALYNQSAKTLKTYPINVVGTVLDTAALVTASKMQADGDDCRVYVDGVETPRWLQGINTTTTKIWIVGDWKPLVKATGPAVGSGALTSVTFQTSAANKAALKNLEKWGGKAFTFYVGTEAVIFSNAVIDGLKITATITRGAKGTTAAAHSAGDIWYWVEHDVWLMYGNSSMAAPDQSESAKPIIDLTSTNTSWVYTSFADTEGIRSAIWMRAILDTDNLRDTDYTTQIYSASRLTGADPATEMGMSIQAFRSNMAWKAEQASLVWSLYHPCGVTTITASGEKYRYTATWPTAKFERSTDGATWTAAWTDVTPTALQTWEALAAHAGVALGATYNYVRFRFSGPQPASAGAQANYAIQDVTLTLDSNYTPTVALGAEQSCYHMQSTITNNTTGDAIALNAVFPLNTKLTVDTDARTVVLADGSNAMAALSWSSVRRDWLKLNSGANVLQFDDTGTNGVTMVVKWRDRSNG